MHVRVQSEAFDAGAELAALAGQGVGAVASFIGVVRDDDGLTELFLDHYPAMTEAVLVAIAQEAQTRWTLSGLRLIHRVGALYPGESIVLVATASKHRADALDACAYVIDRLKVDAPFWKREKRAGMARWVEARASDDEAAARWRDGLP
jgi:molybdopterin synthase catalytic subunit